MSAAAAPVHTRSVAEPDRPWLGLQSYAENDQELFFGRETERDELFRLVERGVLTVMYGVSGLGKTSLLNAGLFPKLREESYLPISIRVRFGTDAPDPIAQLRQAIEQEIVARCTDTPVPGGHETLWEYFHRTPLWNHRVRLLTPVLVFDQFEEVLTFGQKDARAPDLFEALADLVENYIPRSVRRLLEGSQDGLPLSYDRPKLKLIFSLREDYLAKLQDLRPLMPSLMRNCYRLKPMSGAQAREAVIGPARQAGLDIAGEVAGRIVRIAAGETQRHAGMPVPLAALEALEVEPVLLSLFCDELNRKRIERGLATITEELAQGERGRILSDFYDRCMAKETQEVRRYIEDDLLTKEGHRDIKAVENLPDAAQEAADRLINLRLLRREERLGRPYVELIHDVLTEPILASRSARRELEAVDQERQRQEDARSRERAQLEAKARRSRERAAILGVAAAACVVLACVAGWFWQQAHEALVELENTRSKMEEFHLKVPLALRLAWKAKGFVDRPDTQALGMLLAIESLNAHPTPEATEALSRQALTEVVLPIRPPIKAAAFSPDGKWLATARGDEVVQVWDASSSTESEPIHQLSPVTRVAFGPDGRLLAIAGTDYVVRVSLMGGGKAPTPLTHRALVTGMAFSTDGRRLATGSADNIAQVWDADNGSQLKSLPHPGLVTGVTFSPDDKRIATASADKTVRLWDAQTGAQYESLEHPALVTAVAFSPDGKRLATASADYTVRVWEADTGKQLQLLKHPALVTQVAFNPDNKRLATAGEDKSVRLWDMESPQEPTTFLHDAAVSAIVFRTGDERLATASGDGKVRRWHWKVTDIVDAACDRLSRNLTRKEWQQYFGHEPYRRTCPRLAEGE